MAEPEYKENGGTNKPFDGLSPEPLNGSSQPYKITRLPRKEPGQIGRPKTHEVVNLAGKRFGSWTLLLCTTPGKGMTTTRYICRCDCGHQQEMQIHNILASESVSCKGNCGRGQQLREYGILDPGQTPGTSKRNLERWRRILEERRESGWYEKRRLA